MKKFVAKEAEGVAIADVIQREHVKRPIIDTLSQNRSQSQSCASVTFQVFWLSISAVELRYHSIVFFSTET